MTKDIKGELVQFLLHKAFYPVLMAQRDGPDRTKIEHVQEATRAEIERFRSYRSAEEVMVNFQRDLNSKPAKTIHSELKALNLPIINDVREEFERKAKELGVNA